MKKLVASVVLVTSTVIGLGGVAGADPSFGPGAGNGQGNNEPHENAGTKCHPPGQTSELPECK
jgi:hypothetical protein